MADKFITDFPGVATVRGNETIYAVVDAEGVLVDRVISPNQIALLAAKKAACIVSGTAPITGAAGAFAFVNSCIATSWLCLSRAGVDLGSRVAATGFSGTVGLTPPSSGLATTVRAYDQETLGNVIGETDPFDVASLAAPAVVRAVAIVGNAIEGASLVATPASFSGDPVPTVVRAWLRDAAVISGQTGLTYTAVTGDIGATITCRETATNSQGSIVSASNGIGPITAIGSPSEDVQGISVQNTGGSTLAAGTAMFGQSFASGALPSNKQLIAQIGGVDITTQVDVKTTHADGSARMALVAIARPGLAAGATVAVNLTRRTPGSTPTAVDLAAASNAHTCVATFTGGLATTVDVLSSLRAAITGGAATYWRSGALVTEARVDVTLAGSMRLVADVAAFADGSLLIDLGFRNDRSMETGGSGATYDVVVALNSVSVITESLAPQRQYQSWSRLISTGGTSGHQRAVAGMHIRHDMAKLEDAKAIPRFDFLLTIPPAKLANYASQMTNPNWGKPLAANGIVKDMGTTGGRPDIGFTTEANAAWIISQDPRAAAFAMSQADASGAIPWNFWDRTNGTWLNTDRYPNLWTDGRGGTGTPGNSASTGLVRQVDGIGTGWSVDSGHQPDLASVPYLLTGRRGYLDAVQAQASRAIMSVWPQAPRAVGGETGVVMSSVLQVREVAWTLRQIDNAAWLSPTGSVEQIYFNKISVGNYNRFVVSMPVWQGRQGTSYGWKPGEYGTPGALAPWQQDFLASTCILAAERGNNNALLFMQWAANYLVGRFQQSDFRFNDGATYNIGVAPSSGGALHSGTSVWYTTWAEISASTIARGMSNGTGWLQSDGYYGQLALATLAGLSRLGIANAAAMHAALLAAAPPYTSPSAQGNSPQFAIRPPA